MGKIMEIAQKNNTEVHEHNDLNPSVGACIPASFKSHSDPIALSPTRPMHQFSNWQHHDNVHGG